MSTLAWALAALVLVILAGALGLWMTGRFARLRRGAPSFMLPPRMDGPLDALAAPAPGLSSVRLIADGAEALAQRLTLARRARRSLDLLYYLWEDDLTGRLLAHEVLAAADRGVRVRVLLDDVSVLGRDPVYRTLDRHPKIEVRLFNPIRSRRRGLLRGVEILLRFLPLNRRMHGKIWLADGRVAILGGRNLGDAYFLAADAGAGGYHDLDVIAAGAVCDPVGALFDAFWNADVALSLRMLWPKTTGRLRRIRARLARRLTTPQARARLDALRSDAAPPGLDATDWAPGLFLVADPPQKATAPLRDDWLAPELLAALSQARVRVRLASPYLVPGRTGLQSLIALRQRGVAVDLVTNGLALADNPLVQGAWAWYRPRLLAAGVTIHELGRTDDNARMLHAKALLIDDHTAYVGSSNFDLRSALLNTETGLLARNPGLAHSVAAEFDRLTAPETSWRLGLDAGRLCWQRGALRTRTDPDSTAPRRWLSALIGHLPVHRWL